MNIYIASQNSYNHPPTGTAIYDSKFIFILRKRSLQKPKIKVGYDSNFIFMQISKK